MFIELFSFLYAALRSHEFDADTCNSGFLSKLAVEFTYKSANIIIQFYYNVIWDAALETIVNENQIKFAWPYNFKHIEDTHALLDLSYHKN